MTVIFSCRWALRWRLLLRIVATLILTLLRIIWSVFAILRHVCCDLGHALCLCRSQVWCVVARDQGVAETNESGMEKVAVRAASGGRRMGGGRRRGDCDQRTSRQVAEKCCKGKKRKKMQELTVDARDGRWLNIIRPRSCVGRW